MALRPGRQRSSATPIIAKGSVYPLQNRCASKLATHGFASKSDTHHKTKDHPRGGLLFWLIDGRTRKAALGKAPVGLFNRRGVSAEKRVRRTAGARKAEISPLFSKFCRCISALCASFRVCRQILTGETVEMFTKLWYNKKESLTRIYTL